MDNQDDVTEGQARQADFGRLVLGDRPEWRRRAARVLLWVLAGAISLLANAELFMLLAHRDVGETKTGPRDPDVVMIDLPAAENAPASVTRPVAVPETLLETPPDASHEAPTSGTATREPERPVSPNAATAPAEMPRLVAPPVARATESWSVAPIPVRRSRSHRRAEVVRRVVQPSPPRRISKGVAPSPARTTAAQQAASSAFADASSAADWKSQVVAALNRAKRYPGGIEVAGSPTIRMMVAASGDVARVVIVASSGSSVLDSAALETVRRTSPLPPPPGGMTGLTFRMNFHLRGQ